MSITEFNALLLHHAHSLKPFAINLTRNNEVANDLYQETLYKALANREKYHTGSNIRAWLFTIMRNIFINEFRKKVRHQAYIGSQTGADSLHEKSAFSRNTAEERLAFQEISKKLFHLPEVLKLPFLLHFEGYRYQEIAEALNEPLGTIKSRIHIARKVLKQQLIQNEQN
jgi:RNA polymerase sigma-70 factor (ECF subfamily)